jgi:hypothetical protein
VGSLIACGACGALPASHGDLGVPAVQGGSMKLVRLLVRRVTGLDTPGRPSAVEGRASAAAVRRDGRR